jgi:hypothetical protein
MKTIPLLLWLGLLLPLCVISSTSQSNPNTSTSQACSTSHQQSQTQGHTVELSGKVRDMKGQPVRNAKVALLPDCDCKTCPDYPKGCSCCPDQLTLYTDESGSYRADVQPGKYSLAVGGKKKMVDVHLAKNATADFKVNTAEDTYGTNKDTKKVK